ncbi:hypothetical protein ACFYTV_17450 [Streptomyces sp. NPDC004562]|uniref:hypothetical protein n=1 Tax=Streptomyces sp. NPDC004562 TaxID=3364703 RepID=UPI003694ED7D
MVVCPGAVTVYGVSSRYVASNGGGTVVVEPDESKPVDELRAELPGKGERAAQDAVLAELADRTGTTGRRTRRTSSGSRSPNRSSRPSWPRMAP